MTLAMEVFGGGVGETDFVYFCNICNKLAAAGSENRDYEKVSFITHK